MRDGGGRKTQGLKTTIASDERAHSDNNEPPPPLKKKTGRHLNIMASSFMSIDNKRETIACVGNSKLKDRCIF